MSAFPVVGENFNEEGYTPENIETSLLRMGKHYNNLIENEGFDETKDMTISKVLTNARAALLQTASI